MERRKTVEPGLGRAEADRIAELSAALAKAQAREAKLRKKIQDQEQKFKLSSSLLHEVNHRAKNSLQMAVSLLSLQANASESEEAEQALKLAAQRIGYLARAHEMLYKQEPGFQKVSIGEYLSSITNSLRDGFGRHDVEVEVEIGSVRLDAEQAANVGLIVGEATINALKHAFRGRGGILRISCRQSGSDVTVAIEDDGVGFPEERKTGSLGMRLIRTLSRGLGGDMKITTGSGGTALNLTFPAGAEEAHTGLLL